MPIADTTSHWLYNLSQIALLRGKVMIQGFHLVLCDYIYVALLALS